MSRLRSSAIRLAYLRPELRPLLLPILKEACGYMADEDEEDEGSVKAAKKQMHDVKEKDDLNKAKGKADKPRDPYARSLAQGQFQSKVMNPDKRKKLRDKWQD